MCTPADRGYLVGIKYVLISSLCLGTSSLPNMLNDLGVLEESGLFRTQAELQGTLYFFCFNYIIKKQRKCYGLLKSFVKNLTMNIKASTLAKTPRNSRYIV